MPEETLKTIEPREYQQQIYNTCKDKNCLVVLPTGIGKTLIGLMLAINRQKSFPGSKVLFLAPTRPLAEQHLKYFKKYLPELFASIDLFTGSVSANKRKELFGELDIIFSTPQCISNDIKNRLYTLEDVSLLIEDECHRCLKNYSYTYVAQEYKKQAKNQRLLGLTASPGAEKSKIIQIAKNLGVEAIELRTRESEDVKPYLQELKFHTLYVPFPPEFMEIKELLNHLYQKKVEELQNRKVLFSNPTKITLLETQGRIMASISRGNRNFNMMAAASACAQAIKIIHAIELLETQTLFSFHEYLENLIDQAKKNKSKAVIQLTKRPEFLLACTKLTSLLSKNVEHPKLIKTKQIIKNSIESNIKHKTIIFTQFRDTATRISKEINLIPNINAKVFVGQTKKSSKTNNEQTGLSQKEQAEIIKNFSLGNVNVLVATSIGEEGLDIPEVDTVIFYEPVPSAIRKIQRAGRTARLQKGRLIILVTKATRDEAYYWSAIHKEKRMHNAIKSIQEDLSNGKPLFQQEKEERDKNNNETQKRLF